MLKLVDVIRSGKIESTHYGHIAVVDAQGKLLYSAGDPDRWTCARSSIKPFQALPIVQTGTADNYDLTDKELALCCGSHIGEKQHIETVFGMLERAGIRETTLRCGTNLPPLFIYRELIRKGKDIAPVHHNCSGKHAGMLLTAKYLNEELVDYHKPDHPVQQRIMQTLARIGRLTPEEIEIGIDGCGVPAYFLSLERWATIFARFADSKSLDPMDRLAAERITRAMTTFPEMVAGSNEFCTELMKVGEGRWIAKGGAEAVYCIGDRETGLGIAIKVEDGALRAVHAVAVEVLKQLDLLREDQLQELMGFYKPTLKNGREEEVGHILPSFQLTARS
ncbi:L-asparaginase II [Croceifilum oryzae]|uniref:L-asparaginase II n=1 Tax=Croceifilum oryzae TaxID=1553429 RepID=A0AAJ1TFJ5_9BACL|nr:asparaginase [Croceifilum oryzae]MDQ0417963.1 L-asparaginase II [Croceifilum oryzae]